MKKTANRPQRLNSTDVDMAVEEALARVAQANAMTDEECLAVSGGLVSRDIIGPTTGLYPTNPLPTL